MPTNTSATLLLAALLLPLGSSAASRDDLVAQYALSAKAASPAFSGFSAVRGEKLHFTKFAGGKAETPSIAETVVTSRLRKTSMAPS